VEGIDHLGCFGQDHHVHRGIDGRHVEGSIADPLLPGGGLGIDPARHLYVVAAREDVDDLVAGSIVYLASDLSAAMTGQAIDTNGGEIFT
jgi:hypothetical protein